MHTGTLATRSGDNRGGSVSDEAQVGRGQRKGGGAGAEARLNLWLVLANGGRGMTSWRGDAANGLFQLRGNSAGTANAFILSQSCEQRRGSITQLYRLQAESSKSPGLVSHSC